MAKKKYNILLIEPSEIVATGVAAIVNKSNEFKLTTILPDTDYLKQVRTAHDIIIINPTAATPVERQDIRTILDAGSGTTAIVALSYDNLHENELLRYDGSIGIHDTPERIYQKLHNAIKECSENKNEAGELSARERDILVSVAKGKTNKEIADRYNISIYTVISHRRNISRKLGINSIPGLTVYAIMNKLIDISDIQ
jgi:DNA-binding NarL/FixJ family response regulator